MHLQLWKGVKTGLHLQSKTPPRTALVAQGNSLFFVTKEVGGWSLWVREGCLYLHAKLQRSLVWPGGALGSAGKRPGPALRLRSGLKP